MNNSEMQMLKCEFGTVLNNLFSRIKETSFDRYLCHKCDYLNVELFEKEIDSFADFIAGFLDDIDVIACNYGSVTFTYDRYFIVLKFACEGEVSTTISAMICDSYDEVIKYSHDN